MEKKILFRLILVFICAAILVDTFTHNYFSLSLTVPLIPAMIIASYGYYKNDEQTNKNKVYYIPSLYLFLLILLIAVITLGLFFKYPNNSLFAVLNLITIILSIYGVIKELKNDDIYD